MHPKDKIDAATSAAQDAATSAQESLNAAAKDAAAAAREAAEQIKNTVKDYFPTGKIKEMHEKQQHHHHHHLFHEQEQQHHMNILPDKTHMLSFLAMPYMAVIIALFVVLISALFFMRRRKMIVRPLRRLGQWFSQKSMRKSTVLICGPVDAGKTLLFHTLSGGKFQPTQTSMEENVNSFKIHEKILGESKKDKLKDINFEFIDFPGHPSKELKLNKFLNNLQGVIVLVDSSSGDSITNGAKTLFSLMEKKGFLDKKVPVLICANKMDLDNSQTLNAIRQKILEELNKLKDNRSSMENIEKRDEDITTFGKSGEKLTWENMGLPVSFGQISAKQGSVIDVLDFLEGIQNR